MKINKKTVIVVLGILILGIILSNLVLNKMKANKVKKEIDAKKSITTINTKDMNLKKSQVPEGYTLIGIPSKTEQLLLKDNSEIWIYKENEQVMNKIVKEPIDKENVIGSAKYSKNWIVWIEDSDKVLTGGSLGERWAVVAKNINTNETIVIDKSKKIDKLKYRYAPSKIEIYDDKVVYNHIDYDKDTYLAVVKYYNLTERKLDTIETLRNIENKNIARVSIYDDIIGWSSARELSNAGNLNYKYSDLYTYNINTKEKKQVTKNKYIVDFCIYKNKIYGSNYIEYKSSELVEIDLQNNNNITTIFNYNSDPGEKHGSEYYYISDPQVKNDILFWWYIGGFWNNFYYDLKTREFKSMGSMSSTIVHLYDNYIYYYSDSEKIHKIKEIP